MQWTPLKFFTVLVEFMVYATSLKIHMQSLHCGTVKSLILEIKNEFLHGHVSIWCISGSSKCIKCLTIFVFYLQLPLFLMEGEMSGCYDISFVQILDGPTFLIVFIWIQLICFPSKMGHSDIWSHSAWDEKKPTFPHSTPFPPLVHILYVDLIIFDHHNNNSLHLYN